MTPRVLSFLRSPPKAGDEETAENVFSRFSRTTYSGDRTAGVDPPSNPKSQPPNPKQTVLFRRCVDSSLREIEIIGQRRWPGPGLCHSEPLEPRAACSWLAKSLQENAIRRSPPSCPNQPSPSTNYGGFETSPFDLAPRGEPRFLRLSQDRQGSRMTDVALEAPAPLQLGKGMFWILKGRCCADRYSQSKCLVLTTAFSKSVNLTREQYKQTHMTKTAVEGVLSFGFV